MIYTIGHGMADMSLFMATLRENGIEILIDVRSSPYSKRAPQFNRDKLEKVCRHKHIEYLWRGKSLGGFGEIPEDFFMKGIVELLEKGVKSNIVLMCSETDYKRCHRYYKITPELEKAGLEVTHLKVIEGARMYRQTSLILGLLDCGTGKFRR